MARQPKFLLLVVALIVLPIAGYVASYLAITVVSPGGKSIGYHALLTLMLTLGLLVVPYVMIKLLAHAAHTFNPREKVPHLRDIPKDKNQLGESM